MKKTIAACMAAIILSFSLAGAGFYIYQNYNFVGSSIISNSDMEKINQFGMNLAMQGYAVGKAECKKDM